MRALLCFALVLNTVQPRVMQFYIEPSQKVLQSYIRQLVVGNINKTEQGIKMTASVSLIFDSGHYIVVDSPSATNINAKVDLLKGLSSQNISPGEVQFVVTTHGHPDHFGQGNFFPNARHFFGSYEYNDDVFISTELKDKSTMKITKNVEIWSTPGHTSQDISIIAYNTPCCGTVAVVGDLFYNEADALNGTEWYNESWNPSIGKINREKVLCSSDYIIPGHGPIFKVSDQMKINCENDTLSLNLNFPSLDSNSINITTNTSPTTTTLDIKTPATTTPSSHLVTVDQILELQAPFEDNITNAPEEEVSIPPEFPEFSMNIIEQADSLVPAFQSAAKKLAEFVDDDSLDNFSFSDFFKKTFKKLKHFKHNSPTMTSIMNLHHSPIIPSRTRRTYRYI